MVFHSMIESNAQEANIVLPAGKLAAVTRKKNEILPLLNDPSKHKVEITKLYGEFLEKLDALHQACSDIEITANDQGRVRIDEWRNVQIANVQEFRSKVNFILQTKSGEVPLIETKHYPKIQPEKGEARAVSPDRKSWISTVSGISNSSSVRIKLAERKAKVIADKVYHDKISQLDEEEIKRKRSLQKAAIEREELETQILEQELNKLDKIANVLESESVIEMAHENRNEKFFQHLQSTAKKDPFHYEIPSTNPSTDQPNYRPLNKLFQPRINEPYQAAFTTNNSPEMHLNDNQAAANNQLTRILEQQNQITATLARNQERASLPTRELTVFDGSDITQFPKFIRTFKQVIEDRCNNGSECLYYLEQYTSGAAQRIVKSVSNHNAEAGYRKAICLLEEEYGNEYRLANSYIQRLENWAPIRNEDQKTLNELTIFMMTCENNMANMDSLNQLNSPNELMQIVKKLPYELRKKWRDKTLSLTENCQRVQFSHLVELLRKHNRLISQPVFGDIKDASTKPLKLPFSKKKVLVTKMNQNQKEVNETCGIETRGKGSRSDLGKYCQYCQMTNHTIDYCNYFDKLNYDNKVDSIKRLKLCFACLKQGHTSKGCTERLTCRRCKYKHATCLHREPTATTKTDINSKQDYSDYNLQTGAGKSSRVACAVVPVKIKVKGKKNLIETYAALDNCSSACFMDSVLLDQLGVKGKITSIPLTTMHSKNVTTNTIVINDLEIFDFNGVQKDTIPVVYAQSNWPFSHSDSPKENLVRAITHLKEVPFDFIESGVGILIGLNRPELIKPLEIVDGPWNAPYASLHRLGWAINGPLDRSNSEVVCNRLSVERSEDYESLNNKIKDMYEEDFKDSNLAKRELSVQDKIWEDKVKNSIELKDSHYVIELPFKEKFEVSSNKKQVYRIFMQLKNKFMRNDNYFEEYKAFMDMMIDKGFLETVSDDSDDGWYVSHHGVYHKKKLKLRVVFNCSLKNSDGVSLNDALLQGPDLTNNLLGILLRFRQGKIAFMADIQNMFFQVKVPEQQRDYLKIFWFQNSDLNSKVCVYRLSVHLFGAVSSPSVCNFALKQTALDNVVTKETESVINSNFYVDDLLCSVDTESEAIELISDVRETVQTGGFTLTQFVSNSKVILNYLPMELLASHSKEILLGENDMPTLPNSRALGLIWDVNSDTFKFCFNFESFKNRIPNRRTVLSVIHSMYDPIGLIGPVLNTGKKLFQETCTLKLDWDHILPDYIRDAWIDWLNDLKLLNGYSVPRCINSQSHQQIDVHYFADASETSYGAIAYTRVCSENEVRVCPLIAKSRLTPIGNNALKTVPRIELNAAKIAVLLQQIVHKELSIPINKEYFWSDSSTTLSYIKNDTYRYHRFIANRVAFIRSNTSPDQWYYVPSKSNPADIISREVSASNFVANEMWKNGPKFLHDEEVWPEQLAHILKTDDIEIKCNVVKNEGECEHSNIEILLESSSSFFLLKTKVAWFLRYKDYLRHKLVTGPLTVKELTRAEHAVIKYVQQKYLANILDHVSRRQQLPKHPILKLNPFFDGEFLRVGGRLENSKIPFDSKHQIIVPRVSIAKLIIEEAHKRYGHMGREVMVANLRTKYWILGINKIVREVLKNCVICNKVKRHPCNQIMAPLPIERVTGDRPPFYSTGIDFFGPFMVKNGRKISKRYGVIFTCLASRAAHLEMADSLDTDSFINAFRRFKARRGNCKVVRSDNGTNMKAGERELREQLQKWDLHHIDTWMKKHSVQWIFLPPRSPHMGGIWEREVRTIKSVLSSIMKEQIIKLNDDCLNTLLCEIEAILNSRPLSELSQDPDDMEPLTPNHLLLLHDTATYPPGLFSQDHLYLNRRWKQVQYLSDLFWSRWRKQYLPLLQTRQRWFHPRRSLKVNDLVLVVDNLLPRNQWNVGRVCDVITDSKGHVRSARLKVARYKDGRETKFGTTELERPIVKLILLKEAEDVC